MDYENDTFIGHSEIHIKHPALKEYQSELFDNYFGGKSKRSQFCVDTGLDLIPTAYCLSCIYDCARKLPIINWCLQVNSADSFISNYLVLQQDSSSAFI